MQAIPEPPEDSVQALLKPDSWWEPTSSGPLERGRLIRTFVPLVDQEPCVLVPEGRANPTGHDAATYRIEPLNIKTVHQKPKIPIAGLPAIPGEQRVLYRGKVRPALVLSIGGEDIPRSLVSGSSRWLTAKTLLVAPYYGADQNGMRGGWPSEFVTRIRHAEYPQYVWDSLPIGGTTESILRLDQLQAVGRDSKPIEPLPWCLNQDALRIIDEWVLWVITGGLPEDGLLSDIRRDLMES